MPKGVITRTQGCKCKKTKCLKDYCVCHKNGLKCTPACECIYCNNSKPTRKRPTPPRNTRYTSKQLICKKNQEKNKNIYCEKEEEEEDVGQECEKEEDYEKEDKHVDKSELINSPGEFFALCRQMFIDMPPEYCEEYFVF